jgi:hypothetical protein
LKSVVFYGVGEVAEIAYLSLQGAGLELVGVVDDREQGREFLAFTVKPTSFLQETRFDRVIVTSIESDDVVLGLLSKAGIPEDKICFLKLGQTFTP